MTRGIAAVGDGWDRGGMYSSSLVVRGAERRDGAVFDMLERSRDDGSRGVLVIDLGGERWRVELSPDVQQGRVWANAVDRA